MTVQALSYGKRKQKIGFFSYFLLVKVHLKCFLKTFQSDNKSFSAHFHKEVVLIDIKHI